MIRRLPLPATVAGQIASLLLVSVLISQSIGAAVFFLAIRRGPSPAETTGQIVALVRLTEGTDVAARPGFVGRAAVEFPVIDPALMADMPDASDGEIKRPVVAALEGREIRPVGEGRAAVRLVDGGVLAFRLPVDDNPPPPGPLIGAAAFILVAGSLFAGWAAWVVTAPLRRFAEAAERFAGTDADPPLSEAGPKEVARAAAAFNRMRVRIARLVEDRTRMLAAVSHDLRTPVTRLRLRAELIEDPEVREPMLEELDHVTDLIRNALSHLSDRPSRDEPRSVDLPSLLQSACDRFVDLGHDVVYEGPDRLDAKLRGGDIAQAVQNLLDNAVRTGTAVIVRLSEPDDRIVIAIVDGGPGIASEDRDRLIRPFERGDPARSADGRGFGLGLSIARSIAERHGGRLVLADAVPQGLEARIELPRTAPQAIG